MKSATERLIELAERLNPTGVIGDGMVAEFHSLAARARLEQFQPAARFSAPWPVRDYGGYKTAVPEKEFRAEYETEFGPALECSHAYHAFPTPNPWGDRCPKCGAP